MRARTRMKVPMAPFNLGKFGQFVSVMAVFSVSPFVKIRVIRVGYC